MSNYCLALTKEKVDELKQNPDEAADYIMNYQGEGEFSTEIVNALSYVLCDDPWGGEGELSWALWGEEEFCEVPGADPAYLISSEKVKNVLEALEQLDMEEVMAKWNPEEMDEDVLEEFFPPAEEIPADEVMNELKRLIEFYEKAAENDYFVCCYAPA